MEHSEYVELQRSHDVSAKCIVQNAKIASEIVPVKRLISLSITFLQIIKFSCL